MQSVSVVLTNIWEKSREGGGSAGFPNSGELVWPNTVSDPSGRADNWVDCSHPLSPKRAENLGRLCLGERLSGRRPIAGVALTWRAECERRRL